VRRVIVTQRALRLEEMKKMYPSLPGPSGEDTSSAIRPAPLNYGRKLGRVETARKKKTAFFDPRKKVESAPLSCCRCCSASRGEVAVCVHVHVRVRVVCVCGCVC
jgi:hypothetical protein